jgi:hypothetical protein
LEFHHGALTNQLVPMKKSEDRRLNRLSKICLGVPEVTRCYNGQHDGFVIRKETFAHFLNDHHEDGIVALTCKVLPEKTKPWPLRSLEDFFYPLI